MKSIKTGANEYKLTAIKATEAAEKVFADYSWTKKRAKETKRNNNKK